LEAETEKMETMAAAMTETGVVVDNEDGGGRNNRDGMSEGMLALE
jgi:hypothetical protein